MTEGLRFMGVHTLMATAAFVIALPLTASTAWADDGADPAPPAVDAVATDPGAEPPPVADVVDDGRMPPGPPAVAKTPDGWTLTLSSKDEMLMSVAPLTTAISSREYLAGGVFTGTLTGSGESRGSLEVGYEIGCGIDMSTSPGVTLGGSMGITPALGVSGPLGALPTGLAPVIGFPIQGAISVSLKPGVVNIIPVDRMTFEGSEPWLQVTDFHVKIDGCVGQSFIRSIATLTRETSSSHSVLSYVGVTKNV